MALSGIGKPSTSNSTPKHKAIKGLQCDNVKGDKLVFNRPPSTTSQNSQNTPVQSPLPQPLSHQKSQRLSQDSDKTDISQQSSESDRIILESNDDDDDEDEDEKNTIGRDNGESGDKKKELEQSDNSVNKNIEIRRMSSTEEGDKVLQSAWTTPEKDEKGKTPLEMVQNIVSSIDSPKDNDKLNDGSADDATTSQNNKETTKSNYSEQQPSTNNAIPSWVQGCGKPLVHSQQIVANQTPPSNQPNPLLQPLPQPPLPSVNQTTAIQQEQNKIVSGQIYPSTMASSIPIVSQSCNPVVFAPPVNQSQTLASIQMGAGVGQQQVSSAQPPIMQIVNTVNGPMLMQAFPAPSGVANTNASPSDQSNASVFSQGNSVVLPTSNGCIQPSQQQTIATKPPTQNYEQPDKTSLHEGGDEKDEDVENDQVVSKKSRKSKKKKNESMSVSSLGKDSQPPSLQYQPQIAVSQHSQVPVLVANTANIGQATSGQAMIGASSTQQTLQPLIMNQPGALLTNVGGQVLLSNGSFMAVPAVYNQQMPDGSIVQVQNGLTQIPTAPIIPQTGQPVIAGNGTGPILMAPQGNGQFVPSAGAFIMTPQGLVPATPAGMPTNNPSQQGNFVAIAPTGASNQQMQQVTISPAHTPTLVQQQATPPPTQIPQQQQQILTIQQQQPIPSTSMTITLEDDDSDEGSVSMSPPSARSTPIPKRSKQKGFKKKSLRKDHIHKSRSRRDKEIEYHEIYGEDDDEEIRHDDEDVVRIGDDDDDESDVEEIIEDTIIDNDEVSENDDISPTARSSNQSSPSPIPGNVSMSKAKSSKTSNKKSKSKKGSKIFIQSNKVDSSGRKATPPHSADDRLSSSDLFNTSVNPDDSLDTSGMSNSSTNTIGNIDVNEPSSSRGPSRKRRHHKNVSSSSQKKRKRNADILLQEEVPQDESDGKTKLKYLERKVQM